MASWLGHLKYRAEAKYSLLIFDHKAKYFLLIFSGPEGVL